MTELRGMELVRATMDAVQAECLYCVECDAVLVLGADVIDLDLDAE